MYHTEQRYTVDCFTEEWSETKFPENTYYCKTVEEVAKVIKDCSRPIAGILKVEVWINEPDKETDV